MDVGTVPAQAPVGAFRGRSMTLPKEASDGDLVALIRGGNGSAFEAVDARYRSAILGFCRHLLGDRDEAEDAVQHTFLAAYTSILASDQEIDLRPWLYAIARNRCYTILRGRREVTVADLEHGMSEEPDALVQRREDLRDLVLDVNRLPDDQRAALVMAELGAHSHAEIAGVLEVPRAKVKSLVFQARESLMATRTARETDCADIRRQLRAVRGAALRRGALRRHLHECPECQEYRHQLRHQRAQFAAIAPVGLWLALKGLLVRSHAVGRGAPAAGGAGAASAAVKFGALKPLAGAFAAMLSAASAVVAVHSIVPAHPHPSATPRHHAAPARHRQHRAGAATRTAVRVTGVRDPAFARANRGARVSPASARARRQSVRLRTTVNRAAFVDRRLAHRLKTPRTSRHPARTRARATRPPKSPVIGGLPVAIPLATIPVPVALPPLVHGPVLPLVVPPLVPPLVVGPGDHPPVGPGDPPPVGPGDHPPVGPGDPPPVGPGDHPPGGPGAPHPGDHAPPRPVGAPPSPKRPLPLPPDHSVAPPLRRPLLTTPAPTGAPRPSHTSPPTTAPLPVTAPVRSPKPPPVAKPAPVAPAHHVPVPRVAGPLLPTRIAPPTPKAR
jgi:RNA polymerase sigma factor (sigma-70 family)